MTLKHFWCLLLSSMGRMMRVSLRNLYDLTSDKGINLQIKIHSEMALENYASMVIRQKKIADTLN